jgi:pectinesterase
MEPATLSGLESAHILEFLMTLTHPTPELVAGIESGLKWLEEVQITQVGTTHLNGKTIYVSDPASDRIRWARFYDLTNSRPVFPGRDGVLYESFAAMAEKNKLGYDFYTTQPGSILKNGQKKWRKMRAVEADKSERPSG